MILLPMLAFAIPGCALGPRALEKSHGMYNQSFAQVDSEELLLNIVRLRYDDPLAEVEVSAIASQYEVAAQAEARPFFSSQAARITGSSVYSTFTSVLPFAGTSASARPTISMTPIQSGESVARYLRPITLEGMVFFAETSWPISNIFRLWLEGMNGLPNAPSASGPTRDFPPEYAEFQRAAQLLQSIQDRGELTFRKVEEEIPGDPIAADRVLGADLVEARKAGDEYRRTRDGQSWQLVHKSPKLYLDLSPATLDSPEYKELIVLLHLKPGLTRYEVTRSTVGFIERKPGSPPSDKIHLVTRSLVQVLFYISQGVEVPAAHLACGTAKATYEADGRLFDWQPLTSGLFTVKSVCQKRRPACASVAVFHRGYWFFIEDTDHASKSTLTLLRPARRLDLGTSPVDRRNPGPTLTLPVGR